MLNALKGWGSPAANPDRAAVASHTSAAGADISKRLTKKVN